MLVELEEEKIQKTLLNMSKLKLLQFLSALIFCLMSLADTCISMYLHAVCRIFFC